MQTDPMEEWRRLTALYGGMGDVEIRELADQINDLTPNAQQVLRDELKKRGISMNSASAPSFQSSSPKYARDRRTVEHFMPASSEIADPDNGEDDDADVDFTWKTELCDCNDIREARAVATVLLSEGVESWIEAPKPYYSDPSGPRVVVAADQLEQARQIIAAPIPQKILDDLDAEEAAPAFQLPICPKCGAADPTLESVEPSNNWLCESCGYAWSDPVGDEAQRATST
jgi:hypothetical protein